jgi:hypothetical protein
MTTENLLLSGRTGIDEFLWNTNLYAWCFKTMSVFSEPESQLSPDLLERKRRLYQIPAFCTFLHLQSQQNFIVGMMESASDRAQSLKAMTSDDVKTVWREEGKIQEWCYRALSSSHSTAQERCASELLLLVLRSIPAFCAIVKQPRCFQPIGTIQIETEQSWRMTIALEHCQLIVPRLMSMESQINMASVPAPLWSTRIK